MDSSYFEDNAQGLSGYRSVDSVGRTALNLAIGLMMVDMGDMESIDMMRGADRLVRELAGVSSDESVLVVCDTSTVEIGSVIAAAANSIAKDVVMSIVKSYKAVTHGQEPPRTIAEAMKVVEVVFAPTKFSLSHTMARRDASRLGVRCLTLPAPDRETLARTLVESPFSEMKPVVETVSELLSKANFAHVTTPAGTDIMLDLRGRLSVDLEYGYCRKGHPSNFAAPPCIEANIAPVEDTAEGIVVVDACQSAIGLISSPIKLTVKKGTIMSIEGGKEAQKLREILEQVDDPDLYRVAELGIGLNPRARMRGCYIEDESVYGSGHIGIGNNEATMAGKIKAKAHIDNIFWRPTIKLDDQMPMKDGKLVVKGLPEIGGIYIK